MCAEMRLKMSGRDDDDEKVVSREYFVIISISIELLPLCQRQDTCDDSLDKLFIVQGNDSNNGTGGNHNNNSNNNNNIAQVSRRRTQNDRSRACNARARLYDY